MRRLLAALAGFGALLVAAPAARAWELETHVGLTHRAALASRVDAWLRARGLDAGLYEIIALGDRALLGELALVDAALGVTPDRARQPALAWLLAGAALEGARMDRVRHHFVDPRTGGGLDEDDAAGTVRGLFTGASFDGTGMRADRWLDAATNALSRPRLLDDLERAAAAEQPAEREAALARALVCAGALAHVLEAVGDPAHARGDFAVNYGAAGAPLERWARDRYGLAVPAPAPRGPAPARLASFVTAPDGSGLADEVARAFLSPGTLPGGGRALAAPPLEPGREPSGVVAGPWVRTLVGYRRTGRGVEYTFTPAALAEATDALLPRIAARAASLLDFLFRDAIAIRRDGDGLTVAVGAEALGRGRFALFAEQPDGRRTRLLERETRGGAAGTALAELDAAAAKAFAGARRVVALYRGVDAAGEPIVASAAAR